MIGFISLVAIIWGLVLVRKEVKIVMDDSGEPEIDWVLKWTARGLTLVLVLNVVWMVDRFVYKLPNPFDAPKLNLPAEPDKMKEPAKLELEAEPSTPSMKEAREEHNKQLEELVGEDIKTGLEIQL